MALADEFTTEQPQFRPSPNVAAAVLHFREPAPVMTAYGPLSVQPSQEVFNSTQDATARSPIEVTRTSIGERIERMLATLAFHSVDHGQPVIVAERNEFSPAVAQQVL